MKTPHIPTPPTPKLRKRRRPSGVFRSVVKTITYRVVSAMSTMALAWLMFGSWQAAGGFALIDLVLNSILYFSHERVWARIGIKLDHPE